MSKSREGCNASGEDTPLFSALRFDIHTMFQL